MVKEGGRVGCDNNVNNTPEIYYPRSGFDPRSALDPLRK